MATKTYGTVNPQQQKAISGLEFVKGLASGILPLNTIAQTLGYDVVEAESGLVVITMDPTAAHLNPWGTVHGGLTATLLDSCMGLAIQSMLEKGIGSTTLEFKISLVRAITLDTGGIRAEGKVLNCGRRVGMAEGRVTDAKGRLLAHGTTPRFSGLTLSHQFRASRYHRGVGFQRTQATDPRPRVTICRTHQSISLVGTQR
jgi:uncharacterized protein (TIGR00369 family)